MLVVYYADGFLIMYVRGWVQHLARPKDHCERSLPGSGVWVTRHAHHRWLLKKSAAARKVGEEGSLKRYLIS